MKIKRAIFMAVLVIAVAALAVPLLGLRASAAGSAARAKATAIAKSSGLQEVQIEPVVEPTQSTGKITAETEAALGIKRLPKDKLGAARARAVQQITAGGTSAITPLPPGG